MAFFIAGLAALALLLRMRPDHWVAAVIYGANLMALFGISALYHRVSWRRPARRWMRRLDHATIYFFIAGTATGLSVGLPSGTRAVLLSIVWGGAALGALRVLFWPRAAKFLGVGSYIALGWVFIWFAPELYRAFGTRILVFIVLGGLLYTAGAVVYALRRPNPWPRVFGYHEVFHGFVVVAAACHFAAISSVIA